MKWFGFNGKNCKQSLKISDLSDFKICIISKDCYENTISSVYNWVSVLDVDQYLLAAPNYDGEAITNDDSDALRFIDSIICQSTRHRFKSPSLFRRRLCRFLLEMTLKSFILYWKCHVGINSVEQISTTNTDS